MSDSKKIITENQFWQLIGLLTASVKLDERRSALHEGWKEIVNKEAEDRFWDWSVGDDIPSMIRDVKEKLEFDGVIVKTGKSKTNLFWKKVKSEKGITKETNGDAKI